MSDMTRRSLLGTALAGTACLMPRRGRAQGLTPPPLPGAGGPPPMPGAGAPPPLPGSGAPATVLQPGTRLVWYGSSASIPGERQQLEPNENGEWVNKATGQHYHEYETPGPAGAGYAVIDVLAAGEAGYLMGVSSFLIHTDAGNATTLIDANGMTAGPDNVADYWVSPTRLAALSDTNIGGTRVLHMPYTLAGRTYRAIRLQVESAGWSQTTYDLDTGLMIVASSTAQGGPVLIRDPNGQLTQGAGSTIMTYSQIAGLRQTNLPGRGSVFPDAVRGLHTILYRGSRGIVMSGSSMQVPPSPMEVRYEITANSGLFLNARVNVSGFMGGAGSTTDRIVPAGTIGSIWMDPSRLGNFGQNQLIDQDPITGVQIMAVGRMNGLVIFSARTSLGQSTFGYDLRSGMLSATDARQLVGPATDITQLQLVGTQ
jgi:hypothetical protein